MHTRADGPFGRAGCRWVENTVRRFSDSVVKDADPEPLVLDAVEWKIAVVGEKLRGGARCAGFRWMGKAEGSFGRDN